MIVAGTAESPDVRTAIALGVALAAVYFAFRSRRYNRDVFPRLHVQWERSAMCGRCGAVFEA